MKPFVIIVLAGGSASRFRPLKEKNLYKFLGKTILEWQLKSLKRLNSDRIIVIANGNNKTQIQSELSKLNLDTDVQIIEQVGDGQAGAVTTALDNLTEESELLIVNMNDIFTNGLIESFSNHHKELLKHGHCSLTGYKTEKYFPGGYLVLGENNTITSVIEKPGEGNEPSQFVRLVFDYFSNSSLLTEYIKNVQSDNDDVYEVALSEMMEGGTNFKLIEYKDKWFSIKYPWHILNAMEYYLDQIDGETIHPTAIIADTASIRGNVIIEEGVKIFDNAVINGPAYIGKNTIVGNNALIRNSIVGEDCVIGFNSEVARSFLFEEVWLHINYVGDSIIEKNVSFGSSSITANFRLDESSITSEAKGKDMNTNMTKLGAIVGSNVRIGVGVKLMPGITVGDNSIVGPGVILTQHIAANSYVYSRQALEIKENKTNIKETSREEYKNKLKK